MDNTTESLKCKPLCNVVHISMQYCPYYIS